MELGQKELLFPYQKIITVFSIICLKYRALILASQEQRTNG